jgi:signal peptidase II
VFQIGVGAFLLALLVYTIFFAPPRVFCIVALTLILAGGVSNLADRLIYGGYVVDFINVGIGSLRTGVFNLADVAISAGVLMLLAGRTSVRPESRG